MTDADADANDVDEVAPDHLYVCEYDGQETISRGRDVELWNEGLEGGLVVRRDLGEVVHAWTVTEDGVRPRRTDLVTEAGKLVLVPGADAAQTNPLIVEDVSPTLSFPEELFTVGQIRTAAATVDPTEATVDGAELDDMTSRAHAIADRINDGVGEAFEARYESWRSGLDSYPEGTDFRYEVPLDGEWKRRVFEDRTDLSAAQAEVLVTAGFPASMSVVVDVEVPAAAERLS